MEDFYICKGCGEEWGYFPEDYPIDEHPYYCPLCSMPLSQALKDIWDEEGLSGVLFMGKIILAKMKGFHQEDKQ